MYRTEKQSLSGKAPPQRRRMGRRRGSRREGQGAGGRGRGAANGEASGGPSNQGSEATGARGEVAARRPPARERAGWEEEEDGATRRGRTEGNEPTRKGGAGPTGRRAWGGATRAGRGWTRAEADSGEGGAARARGRGAEGGQGGANAGRNKREGGEGPTGVGRAPPQCQPDATLVLLSGKVELQPTRGGAGMGHTNRPSRHPAGPWGRASTTVDQSVAVPSAHPRGSPSQHRRAETLGTHGGQRRRSTRSTNRGRAAAIEQA